MKRMLLMNMWGIMIGWCLYFSGLNIIATIELLLLVIVNMYLFNKVNYWRFIFMFTIISILSLAITYISKLSISLTSLPFLLLVSFNLAFLNEISYFIKRSYIRKVLVFTGMSLLVFLTIALLIPYTPLLPNYKTNLYGYISLIFSFPFINLAICLASK